MMPATVIERRTASGVATSIGMSRASRGTAIRASPKPKADRITAARKTTATTQPITQPSAIAASGVPQTFVSDPLSQRQQLAAEGLPRQSHQVGDGNEIAARKGECSQLAPRVEAPIDGAS